MKFHFVPEPGSLLLLTLGISGLCWTGVRRNTVLLRGSLEDAE